LKSKCTDTRLAGVIRLHGMHTNDEYFVVRRSVPKARIVNMAVGSRNQGPAYELGENLGTMSMAWLAAWGFLVVTFLKESVILADILEVCGVTTLLHEE